MKGMMARLQKTVIYSITLILSIIGTGAGIEAFTFPAGRTSPVYRVARNEAGQREKRPDRGDPEVSSSSMQRGVNRGKLPGKWLSRSPSQLGFKQEALGATVEKIGRIKGIYSVIVVRNGYLAVEEYFRQGNRSKPHNLKSASKSVLSALIGIAIDEGYLGLNQPIRDILPQARILNDPRKASITVRHLLTMTSGLSPTSYQAYSAWVSNGDWVKTALDGPLITEPGTHFSYSTGNSHLLSAVLTAVTGISTRAFAQEKLFDPMSITIHGWGTDPEGIYQGGNNLSLIPLDMAKIGLLYLHGGKYGDRQLVPKDWVDASTRAYYQVANDVYGSYGYLWFSQPGGEDAFVAVGYGGQYIYVSTPYDCVIVITATLASKGRSWERQLFAYIQDGILGNIQTDRPRQVRIAGRAETRLNLRRGPSRDDSIIVVFDAGTPLEIKEQRDRWLRVRANNLHGWVFADYVQIDSPETIARLTGRDDRTPSGKPEPTVEPEQKPEIVDALSPPQTDMLRGLQDVVVQLRQVVDSQHKTIAEAVESQKQLAEVLALSEEQRTIMGKRLQDGETRRQALVENLAKLQKGFDLQREGRALSEAYRQSQAAELAGMRNTAAVQTDALEAANRDRENLKAGLARVGETLVHQQDALDVAETDLKAVVLELDGMQAGRAVRDDALKTMATDRDRMDKELDRVREDAKAEQVRLSQELARQQETEEKAMESRKQLADALALSEEQRTIMGKRLQDGETRRQALVENLAKLQKGFDLQREGRALSQAYRQSLAAELAGMRNHIMQVRDNLKIAEDDRETLDAELTEVREALADQQQALADAKTEGTAVGLRLEAMRITMVAQNDTLKTMQLDRERINRKLASATEDRAEAKAEQVSLHEELDRQQKTIEAAGHAQKQLVEALASSEKQRTAMGERLHAIDTDRQALAAGLSRAREDLDLRREATALSEAYRQSQAAELAGMRNDIKTLRDAVKIANHDRENLDTALTEVGEALTHQQQALVNADTDQKAMGLRLEGMRTRLVTQNDTLKTMQIERDRTMNELTLLREEGKAEKDAAMQSLSERDVLKTELVAARKRISTLEAAYNSQRPKDKPVTPPIVISGTSETSAPPAPMPLPRDPDIRSLNSFVQSWAAAWGRKDVRAYLSHYSKRFQPAGGIGLTAWYKQREKRLLKPAFIKITIGNMWAEMRDPSRGKITFTQMYRSEGYVDRVTKALDIQWENGEWKIVKETSH